MPALSDTQRILLLQFVPRLPAVLSLFGSSLILVAVLNRHDALKKEPYHRMMFCLSLYDILGGIWMALGSIPVPGEYGIPGSMGNTQVCSAQGFFIHFTAGATNLYNTALVIYFLMKVRYNVTDFTIAKWYEPAVHVSAPVVSLANALAGTFTKVFNPIGFGGPSNSPLCYIQAFPPGCDFVPGMECERGGNAGGVMWYIAIVPYIATTSAMMISLALVMHTIVAAERKTRKYQFGATSAPRDPENQTATSNTRQSGTMVIVVGKRCLVYGVVFLNTFLWTTISMIVHNKEPPEWDSFWLGCLAFIFMPLQGFLNFHIYIFPRYKRVHRENADQTRFWALYHSVFFSM